MNELFLNLVTPILKVVFLGKLSSGIRVSGDRTIQLEDSREDCGGEGDQAHLGGGEYVTAFGSESTSHNECGYTSRDVTNSPWPGIVKLFPARESLVSVTTAGVKKTITFCLQCTLGSGSETLVGTSIFILFYSVTTGILKLR